MILKSSQNPATDPRAVLSSAAFHVGFGLLVASLVAVGASLPIREVERSRVVHAELGTVDNRAPADPGGGAFGELGGDGTRPTFDLKAEPTPTGPSSTDLADSLLDTMLSGSPTPRSTAEGAMPGASTSGLGLTVGAGSGGGGGSGGGFGGGVGSGRGPSTEFFGARERAISFVYVIDRSGSMVNDDALGLAKRELLASLAQLPPDARFAAIFFDLEPEILNGADGLVTASTANLEAVRARLPRVTANGGTRPSKAIRAAFDLGPEVIYFLTDGRDLSSNQLDELLKRPDLPRVHVIEFGGAISATGTAMARLASETGGTHRLVDVRDGVSTSGR